MVCNWNCLKPPSHTHLIDYFTNPTWQRIGVDFQIIQWHFIWTIWNSWSSHLLGIFAICQSFPQAQRLNSHSFNATIWEAKYILSNRGQRSEVWESFEKPPPVALTMDHLQTRNQVCWPWRLRLMASFNSPQPRKHWNPSMSSICVQPG